jgi:RNA polymerase sigma factor (sigma-70 family)
MMISGSAFESLDLLAGRLPFHLDDVGAVNACYLRWRKDGEEEERKMVELWIYCFIRRYFMVKFVQESSYNPADFDAIVDVTFEKVERFAAQIQQPERFASWVSVICKNSYLNYLRRKKRSVPLEHDLEPDSVAEAPTPYNDSAKSRLVVLRAIRRLPAYLQECVRLRYLDGLSYEDIGERTGYPLPRIRSYINKALKRLREDHELLELLQGDD